MLKVMFARVIPLLTIAALLLLPLRPVHAFDDPGSFYSPASTNVPCNPGPCVESWEPPRLSGTTTIGPSGGTLDIGGGAGVDGGMTLSVPSEALQTTSNFSFFSGPSGSGRGVYITATPHQVLQEVIAIDVNLMENDFEGRVGDVSQVRITQRTPDFRYRVPAMSVLDAAQKTVRATIDRLGEFEVAAASLPASPVANLTSPGNGEQLPDIGVNLSWTNPLGTIQYQILVVPFNEDGPGINLIRNAETSFTIAPPAFGGADPNYVLLPDMSYVWRVNTTTSARPPAEVRDWSPSSARIFRTSGISSSTISPVSPRDGETAGGVHPTLVWTNNDPRVFYYEIQVSRDPSFGLAVPHAGALYWELRHGGLTAPLNSYTIPPNYPLEPSITYHWRVRPRVQGDGEPVAWTPAASFQTPSG